MEERRNKIITFVNEHGNITFNELKENFPHVSEMTLRTDLKVLDKEQRLVRIHGGARSLDKVVGNDDFLKKRFIQNTKAKKIIAKKALEFIESNTTIFLDSGSTTTMLAHILEDKPNIFVTSGLTCAIEIARLERAKVVLSGGNINRHSLSVNGIEGIRYIEKINFDIAFIGVTRYSKETSFTCESLEDAELKQTVIKKSRKVIFLMDSSKINQRGTYTICNHNEVDIVISDNELPEALKHEFRNRGIAVY